MQYKKQTIDVDAIKLSDQQLSFLSVTDLLTVLSSFYQLLHVLKQFLTYLFFSKSLLTTLA